MKPLLFATLFLGVVCGHSVHAETLQSGRSATLARDVSGFSLGSTYSEVRAKVKLISTGNGIFRTELNGINYEFDFSPLGRLYSIHSTQNLGKFVEDQRFRDQLTVKLRAKYGNTGRTNPWYWAVVEPVKNAAGVTIPTATNWLSVLTLMDGSEVELVMQMTDFRILWADQQKLNRAPRDKASEAIAF
jgi:hypothetical protein